MFWVTPFPNEWFGRLTLIPRACQPRDDFRDFAESFLTNDLNTSSGIEPMTALKLPRMSLAAGLAVTALASSSSYALPLVIDDFDTDPVGQLVSISGGSVGSTVTAVSPASGALGGYRLLQAKIIAVNSSPVSFVQASVNYGAISPGIFDLTSSIEVTPQATVEYSAFGVGLNQSLDPFAGLRLEGVENNQSTDYTIRLTTFGGTSSSASISKPALFSGAVTFPWAAFSGGANLLDIDKVELIIDAANDGEVQVDRFLAVDQFGVPDVGNSLGLLGLAGVGLWSTRRAFRR